MIAMYDHVAHKSLIREKKENASKQPSETGSYTLSENLSFAICLTDQLRR